MKKYTQKDFDNFEVVQGVKQCPSGDYTAITNFTEDCSFGGWCSFAEECSFAKGCRFAEECSFGERCSFGENCEIQCHIIEHGYPISVGGIGEYKRTLYVWITEDGIYCQAGCFFGTEQEFMIAVQHKYGDNSAYEKSLNLLKEINNVK